MAKMTSKERRAQKRADEARMIAEMDSAMAELEKEKAKTQPPAQNAEGKKKREVKYTYQPMDEETVKRTRLILGIIFVAIFVVWFIIRSITQ